jgi:hypothetical protein
MKPSISFLGRQKYLKAHPSQLSIALIVFYNFFSDICDTNTAVEKRHEAIYTFIFRIYNMC